MGPSVVALRRGEIMAGVTGRAHGKGAGGSGAGWMVGCGSHGVAGGSHGEAIGVAEAGVDVDGPALCSSSRRCWFHGSSPWPCGSGSCHAVVLGGVGALGLGVGAGLAGDLGLAGDARLLGVRARLGDVWRRGVASRRAG